MAEKNGEDLYNSVALLDPDGNRNSAMPPGVLVAETEWKRLAALQEMDPHWPDRRLEFYKRIMNFC